MRAGNEGNSAIDIVKCLATKTPSQQRTSSFIVLYQVVKIPCDSLLDLNRAGP